MNFIAASLPDPTPAPPVQVSVLPEPEPDDSEELQPFVPVLVWW